MLAASGRLRVRLDARHRPNTRAEEVEALKGLREKGPLRLAIEGGLAGGFMVAIVTRGDVSAAWESAIGIGILCGLIGFAYRFGQRVRAK